MPRPFKGRGILFCQENWNPVPITLCLSYGRLNVKAFARKQRHHLSLLPPTHQWENSVASLSVPVTLVPRLTAFDVMRVNHATIREGESHRVWPPAIFGKFWSSKVITEKKVQHYELKDANLRRVG